MSEADKIYSRAWSLFKFQDADERACQGGASNVLEASESGVQRLPDSNTTSRTGQLDTPSPTPLRGDKRRLERLP
jgi:hypothetical protein